MQPVPSISTCNNNPLENVDTSQEEVGDKPRTAELLAESDNKILSFLCVVALLFANICIYIYIPNYIYTVYNRNIECI